MKIILVTLMDDNFMPGLRGTIKSLLKYNPNFNYPFYILDNGINENSKNEILSIYPNTKFKEINKTGYTIDLNSTKESLLATYYKLEMFKKSLYPKNTERILFLDMDLLIRKNINELINFDLKGKPLGACKQYSVKQDYLVNDINSGVMILDLKSLKDEAYDKMIAMTELGSFLPDQDIINNYFLHDNDFCTYLPKTYNVEKRLYFSKNLKNIFNNCAILHYVNIKPWASKEKQELEFLPVYDIWHNEFKEKQKQKEKIIYLDETQQLSTKEIEEKIHALMPNGEIVVSERSCNRATNCGKISYFLRKKPVKNSDGTWSFFLNKLNKKEFTKQVEDYVYNEYLKKYISPESEESYFNFLKGKRVIFVGPSPIMKDRKLGDFIDSFDIVVRTNNMMNTILFNPDIEKDFGTRTDILYVNVTYERDAFPEWRINDWAKRGLHIICKLMNSHPKEDLPFRWRNIPNRLKDVPPPTLFIGTRLIHDLLSFDIKSLYITGIDAYAEISDLLDGKNKEYIEGYLPEFTQRQRQNRLGKPVSLHDKYRDARLILDFAKDSRVTIDPICREKMEKVAYGKN